VLPDDNVLKVIQQSVQALDRILALLTAQKYPEVLALTDQTLKDFLGLNSAEVQQHSEAELIAMLTDNFGVDVARLLILAELLKTEGDALAALDRTEESDARYLRSLNLFLEMAHITGADERPAARTEEYARIDTLAATLQPRGAIPLTTQTTLYHYYEAGGQYAQAEETLLSLIEASPDPEAAIQEGIAFYRRLLARSDAELAAGGIQRDIIKRSLASLEDFLKAQSLAQVPLSHR